MAAIDTIGRSADQRIDGQLFGTRWSGSTITYSFPDATADYGYAITGFSELRSEQQAVVRSIIETDAPGANPAGGAFSIEGLTNLDLSYLSGGSGAGTLRYANSFTTPTASAYYPNAGETGGDSFYGPAGDWPEMGNYDYHAFLHETGHALGLKHGHETSRFGALPTETDSMEYSVMTYRSYVGSDAQYVYNEVGGYAQTFTMYDIAALQYLYGANFGTNAGNTTYAWRPTSGATIINGQTAIAPGWNRIFATIWDGGGIDTYDLSAYATALSIELAPGGHALFSATQRALLGHGNYARGNIFNALQYQGDPRSLIENAIGGSGADTISGNVAANWLEGRGGDDALLGLAGDDTLRGGEGADALSGGDGDDRLSGDNAIDSFDGGAGWDTVLYLANSKALLIDLTAGKVSFPGQTTSVETLVSVENVEAGSGDDTLIGDANPNVLSGRAGNDRFLGNGAIDVFLGGAGTDTVLYTPNTKTVTIDLAAGTVSFPDQTKATELLSSIENATGGAGQDVILGASGANELRGLAGADRLTGRGGADVLIGGLGDDCFILLLGDSTSAARDVIAAGDGTSAFQGVGVSGGDRIDLAGIDSNATKAGDQAFILGGTGKGQISIINSASDSLVRGNIDGDAAFEIEFRIADAGTAASAYKAVDFIL